MKRFPILMSVLTLSTFDLYAAAAEINGAFDAQAVLAKPGVSWYTRTKDQYLTLTPADQALVAQQIEAVLKAPGTKLPPIKINQQNFSIRVVKTDDGELRLIPTFF